MFFYYLLDRLYEQKTSLPHKNYVLSFDNQFIDYISSHYEPVSFGSWVCEIDFKRTGSRNKYIR